MTQVHPSISAAGSIRDLLHDRFGVACHVSQMDELVAPDWGRSTVMRYWLSGSAAAPATVIAKISNLGPGHLANEAAVLQAVNDSGVLTGQLPEFLGYSSGAEVLLLSDLGELAGRGLAVLRDRVDRPEYLAMLEGLMELTGRLNRLQPAGLPGWIETDSMDGELTGHAAFSMLAAIRRLPRHLRSLGAATGEQVSSEIQDFIALLLDSGAQRLTHADVCPSNCAELDGRILLYDFEVAGMRHPAIDAAWARMRSLRCFHCTVLDPHETLRLEAAWRRGFGWPEIGRWCGLTFGELLSAGCLAWCAAMLDWLPALLEADRERDRVPDRQRLLAAMDSAISCLSMSNGGQASAAALSQSIAELRKRWPQSAAGLAELKP